MNSVYTSQQRDRVRGVLDKIYDHQPTFLKEYLKKYHEDPRSRVFAPLAEAYRKLGRLEDAIKICEEGIKIHPQFHSGRLTLAKCYTDSKKYPEARRELVAVVEEVPENILAQRMLGDLELLLGHKDDALHAYRIVLQLNPKDVALSQKIHSLTSDTSWEASPPPIVETESLAHEKVEIPPPWKENIDEAIDVKTMLDDDSEVMQETTEENNEPFMVEHVSQIFHRAKKNPEITTQTLGQLYFNQGQFQKALDIFEKLGQEKADDGLQKLIESCQQKLGVDNDTIVRQRKIELLEGFLNRLRHSL